MINCSTPFSVKSRDKEEARIEAEVFVRLFAVTEMKVVCE
jgi:hypothetical protein